MQTEVNIPLLRKAVEWAEAEAAKPVKFSQWYQGEFVVEPWEIQRDASCGTCYCIAGWVAAEIGRGPKDYAAPHAAEALGIDSDWVGVVDHLFNPDNTIEDVRRIAEGLAGERL